MSGFPVVRNIYDSVGRDGQRVTVNSVKAGPTLTAVEFIVVSPMDGQGNQRTATAEVTGPEAAALLAALAMCISGGVGQ